MSPLPPSARSATPAARSPRRISTFRIPAILLALALALTACGSAQPPQDPSGPVSYTLSGTILAPAGADVAGTHVVACLLVGEDCDEERSRDVLVETTGTSAPFRIEGLEGVGYTMFALKDSDGDGEFGEGDLYGVRETAVMPPRSDLELRLHVQGSDAEPPFPYPTDPTQEPVPHGVVGTARDFDGRPLQGALIRIEPAVVMGVIDVRTDADGRYAVTGLADMPYVISAFTNVEYRGQTFCLRLGSLDGRAYGAFMPADGTVFDFGLQLTGPIPDVTDGFFGGTFTVYDFGAWAGTGESIEFDFQATGPRIDGSAGESFVYSAPLGSADPLAIRDIPVGPYTVGATLVRGDGTRTPIEMSAEAYDTLYSRMALEWPAASDCYRASGIGGLHVWLASPR